MPSTVLQVRRPDGNGAISASLCAALARLLRCCQTARCCINMAAFMCTYLHLLQVDAQLGELAIFCGGREPSPWWPPEVRWTTLLACAAVNQLCRFSSSLTCVG